MMTIKITAVRMIFFVRHVHAAIVKEQKTAAIHEKFFGKRDLSREESGFAEDCTAAFGTDEGRIAGRSVC